MKSGTFSTFRNAIVGWVNEHSSYWMMIIPVCVFAITMVSFSIAFASPMSASGGGCPFAGC